MSNAWWKRSQLLPNAHPIAAKANAQAAEPGIVSSV
jgi:hypothetical protein